MDKSFSFSLESRGNAENGERTEDTQKTDRKTEERERKRERGREKLTGFDFPIRERATYRGKKKKKEMRIYSTKTPIF